MWKFFFTLIPIILWKEAICQVQLQIELDKVRPLVSLDSE